MRVFRSSSRWIRRNGIVGERVITTQKHHPVIPQFSVSGARQFTSQTTQQQQQPLYWNREDNAKNAGKAMLELQERMADIQKHTSLKEARILSLSNMNDDACQALHNNPSILHHSTTKNEFTSLVGIGSTTKELLQQQQQQQQGTSSNNNINVLFVSPGIPNPKEDLLSLVQHYASTLEWIHIRSAGIDFAHSEELAAIVQTHNIPVTNAKGQFSSVLAEYAIMSCLYFAKYIPKLIQQQMASQWNKFNVLELRNSTIGIIGYGDIGKATAKLAHTLGMNVLALKRTPPHANNTTTATTSIIGGDDEYCQNMYYGREGLYEVLSKSDYVVCCLPLTKDTFQLLDKTALSYLSSSAVLINLGRGAVVDEIALVELLQRQQIRGAALDVFAQEPLPSDHPFWNISPEHLLMSPHNMDQTASFMHEATEFFVTENLPRFILQQPLLNPINLSQGY